MTVPAKLPWDTKSGNSKQTSQYSSYNGRYGGNSYGAGTSNSYRAPSSQQGYSGSTGGYRAGAAIVKPKAPQPTASQLNSGFSSARSFMSAQSEPTVSRPNFQTGYRSVPLAKAPEPQHTLASFQTASSNSIEQLKNLGKDLEEPPIIGSKRSGPDAGNHNASSKRGRPR